MKSNVNRFLVISLVLCLTITALSVLSSASAYYPLSQCTLKTSVNYPGAGWVSPSGDIKYYYGQTITVYANTYTGYVFDGWYLNGVYQGRLTSISITMTQDYTLYAVFSQRTTILTITTNPSDAGTTTPSAGVGNYSAGSYATIYEYPANGNTFSGWYLDGVYQGAGTSITVNMATDHQLSAFFSGNGSVPTPSPSPSPPPTPTPSPNPGLGPAPTLSFYCTSSSTSSGFNVRIKGALAMNGTALSGASLTFLYSATGGSTWHDLAHVVTGDDGGFVIVWMPSASGDYIVKGSWASDKVYAGTTTAVNFSVAPNLDNKMFSVASNSTLSSLSFDSTTGKLSFTVSGPSGTYGYLQACIPKSLLPDVSTLKVALDGTDTAFTAIAQGDVWIVTLGYHHSSHSVVMTIGSTSPTPSSTIPVTTNPTTNPTSNSPTSNPTNNPTETVAATENTTPSPSVPELTPLVVIPLIVVMLGLAIFGVTKKRKKTETPQ